MSLFDAQRAFYREAVPRQFNDTIETQRQIAGLLGGRDRRDRPEGGDRREGENANADASTDIRRSEASDAARLLGEMEAVRTGIRVEVAAPSGVDVHALEIGNGEMRVVEKLERAPFMILAHDLDQFTALREQCGDSVLGFLGAMAGLTAEMKLTSQRVRSLRALAGSLRFEVQGPEGFSLVASFGIDPPEEAPRASISIEPNIFEELKSGALNAQDAFFEEKMQVEGDLELAIGVALAALSPD